MEQVATLLRNTNGVGRELRMQSEAELRRLREQPGFAQVLMRIVSTEQVDQGTRHAASLYLKNVTRDYWAQDCSDFVICEADKQQVRSQLVTLSLTSPSYATRVLAEALRHVAQSDFPQYWPALPAELVHRLSEGLQAQNVDMMNAVLSMMHNVYQKYRTVIELTEELKREIMPVLDVTGQPLHTIMQRLTQQLGSCSDPNTLAKLLRTLDVCVEVFSDLTYLDLGSYFETQVQGFMEVFQQLLSFDKPGLAQVVEDSPLESMKARVLESLTRFLRQFDDDFRPFLQPFSQQVWGLLATLTLDPASDEMAVGAMDFLSAVAESIHHGVFQQQQTIHTICEQIIVPNIRLRESDAEMFSEDPEEFILRDIEGSDQDTRRRSACFLVHGLCKNYRASVLGIFQGYVGQLVEKYRANPTANWIEMDCALYLLTAISTRQGAASVASSGIALTDQVVNIGEFFTSNVLPLLQDGADTPTQISPQRAMLKAGALKFVSSFRRQIPPENYPPCIGVIAKWLLAGKYDVVVTYACSAIERLLFMQHPPAAPGQPAVPYVSKEQMASMAGPLFQNLFQALQTSPRQNPYIMLCLMRVIRSAQEHVGQYIAPVLDPLTSIIIEVAKNPKNPQYNHHLFEAVSSMIRYNSAQVPAIEARIFEPFALHILKRDVVEFMPYVFQIYAQLLEARPDVPACYQQLLPMLVNTQLYANKGTVPAVVRLLIVHLEKESARCVQIGLLQPILGVFQFLISKPSVDGEGFKIVNALVQNFPYEHLQSCMPAVFQVLFARVTERKTPKFLRMLVLFVSILTLRRSPDEVMQTVEAVQAGIFKSLLRLWFSNVADVSGRTSRKVCMVALTRLICECPTARRQYPEEWSQCVVACLSMLTGQEQPSLVPSLSAEALVIATSYEEEYQNVFNPLKGAQKDDVDYCPQVQNPADFFRSSFQMIQSQPDVLPLLQQVLADKPVLRQFLGLQ
eukprot:TRINITY_DN5302_c1_g1_i1.p1 TRINITY_DN5302_c1_g1~~TRINITY_DN5302_c1_g1_i1.p1  ORF type:complete len:993 (+),score=288.35 TRINITY_DN5302_c1_g1_i1:81-2981(+)